MLRLFGLPGIAAVVTVVFSTLLSTGSALASSTVPAAQAPTPSGLFMAQVVGVQWLNPLARRDYPTEWQLLWVLGLAKPNQKDEMVRDMPAKFNSVQSIAGVAFNLFGGNPIDGFLESYLLKTFIPLGQAYVMNPSYFYTIEPDDKRQWRELHGIHVEFAIPNIPALPVDMAATIMRKQIDAEFEFHNVPNLSSANIPADVHTTAGGASVGFTSLGAALDYLQANPTKTAWAMSFDAPDYPKDEQMSENCTLLVLAGPTYNTEREPLAWIGRPAVREATAFEAKQGQPRAAQAWEAAIRAASEQAATAPDKLGYIIHDAGAGEPSGARLGLLGQATTMTMPELDFLHHSFNTPKLLGDMRAGSALTNIALAVAWAHQKGAPVLVAGTTEPGRASAVVVTPPARARLVHPEEDWFRAQGEATAYLPWWGMRKDVDWDKYLQGYSF